MLCFFQDSSSPTTRQKLNVDRLQKNLTLKQAIDEFQTKIQPEFALCRIAKKDCEAKALELLAAQHEVDRLKELVRNSKKEAKKKEESLQKGMNECNAAKEKAEIEKKGLADELKMLDAKWQAKMDGEMKAFNNKNQQLEKEKKDTESQLQQLKMELGKTKKMEAALEAEWRSISDFFSERFIRFLRTLSC